MVSLVIIITWHGNDVCVYAHALLFYLLNYSNVSLGTLVPNCRDQQGKLWLSKKLEKQLTISKSEIQTLVKSTRFYPYFGSKTKK